MNARKFIKTIPMKIYALLAVVVLFAFFSNDFGLVDIQKTAIILAAGIDKTENGFLLTSQIAVPKGSDRTTGGTSSVEIEAEGATVSDCVSILFAKTGWVPKLVFCNLLVIGEEAAKEDTIAYLNYFLRNEYMNDSCKLAVCEGRARELIMSQSAIDDASSLAIDKIFSDSAERSGKVLSNTLKDFAIGYFGKSRSSYLPYVRATDQKGSGDEQKNDGPSQGGSGSESAREKVYSAEETALFQNGKMVGLLNSEETFAFSLLKGKVEAGVFDVDGKGLVEEGTLNIDGKFRTVTLNVLRNEGKIKLDMKGAPTLKLSLDVMVRLCCRGTTSPIEDISTDKVPPELVDRAKIVLEGYVQSLWKVCKESGCDLFELKKRLYRSDLKKYREWKDYLLDSVTPEIATVVKTMK